MGSKWIEILKEMAPQIARVGLIFDPANSSAMPFLSTIEAAAPTFQVTTSRIPIASVPEIDTRIAEFAATPRGSLIFVPDAFTVIHRADCITAAARHRLPSMYTFRYFATDGGLVYYGADSVDLYRRAASYVDRILRGADPAELPVQQPTKFEFVINLRTARALRLDVSPMLLARADQVIE